ncbi:MAG: GH92 family glycosyl hydrolase [Bacteroidales bacterium]|nr:GH92 family glycosyl hydrolase [Bacteroidales bacterium]
MKAFPLALICGLWLTACNPAANSPESTQNVGFESDTDDYTAYVNPMIGTKNMGHTFPGAAVPFGMVQLSPETNKLKMFLPDGTYNAEAYRYCSGYQFNDTTIFGFSHTHFSGTGHSDLGDILILPVVEPINNENPTVKSEKGFSDAFSHDDEKASPGFYSVRLKKNGIKAEMTATERVGFHRYTFPETDQAHLILDLMANIYDYDGKNVWTFLRVENDSTVTGYRQTTGWARTRTVYFAMKFSQPIKAYGRFRADATPYKGFYRKFNESENFPEMAGRELRAYFNFHTVQNEPLMLKVALSPVSTENALNNMAVEAPNWDFDGVKKLAQHKWNIELSKIKVETTTLADKTTFYTALYHTMLSPILYEDTDKSYRGLDQNNHRSEGFTNYTIFSLWDTYRALHPLLNLLHPQRNNDMVHSMLAHHDQSVHKMLPIWSHYANENWCMIGYHAVSVMADAVAKGTTNADFNRILDACVHTAEVRYFDGLGDYIDMGFVPEDKSSNAVSKTLEYAYNDWCIAQIAKKAGRMDVYQQFMARSESYRKVYNATSGYMQPRLSNGSWKKNFDPFDTHGQGFIEGNALNYGLYVPHQLDTMIAMMGGKESFSNHLDMIFNTPIEDKYIIKNEDITRDGIIGNYVHGNEPGHHIPYLYNWTNDSWKTQERVRMILATMYSDKEDGLCGNDDAGQMSAWYIFSAMGFYPVLPGSTDYALGSPSVQKATIQLEDGKQWVVKTINQSADNVYVEKIFLNGEPLKTPSISHDVIKKGGEIIFYMTPQKPML